MVDAGVGGVSGRSVVSFSCPVQQHAKLYVQRLTRCILVELSIDVARDCACLEATIAICEGGVGGLGAGVAVSQGSHGTHRESQLGGESGRRVT